MDARLRRLHKEIADVQKDKSGVTIEMLDPEDISHLKGSFPGPDNTPYASGTFDVDIVVPATYPFQPLKMRFITKVYHPNISSQTGAICLDILKDAWSPVLTLKTALISLQSLLCSPEPTDPQDAEVAKIYMTDRKTFDETATYWTEAFAKGKNPGGGGKSTNTSSSAKKATVANAPDEALLAGLDLSHVNQFTNMGFERSKVIEAMRKLNYRGAKARQLGENAVVEELLR